jgi:tetratricopeptide (TPR) repeat protein
VRDRARAAVALAAAAWAMTAAAQEPGAPDGAPLDLPALPAAALPGLDPNKGRALAAALRTGAYERAEELLVEAAQREGAPPELLRVLGGVSFLRGHYLNAAIALKKAEARAPLDERSRFTLAMSYVVLGRRDWARPELQALARSAPKNALYVYWMARLDYDEAQYADAVAGLLRAVALDDRMVKAHDNLGLCYDALGRYDDALRSFQEAVRLNREAAARSAWPPLNLGLLLTRLDRASEAEPLFREAIRIDPRFPQGHYQLGVALERSGNAPEAVAQLEEAARLDPQYPEPHYALARLYRRRGDVAKADRALELFQRLKSQKKERSATNR